MYKVIFPIVLILSFLAINCLAQDLPDTHAAERAKEVIDLLNDTSPYELDDYIANQFAPKFRDAFPISAHKGIFQSTQSMFGKVKVAEISKSSPNEIGLVLKSEAEDAWLNLMLQVEPGEPYRILMMGFRPASPPAGKKGITQIIKSQHEPKSNETHFTNFDELNKYLKQKSEANEFSGALLIAEDEKPIFKNAYGFATKKNKSANKVDTKFNLGSINKIFTSVAIFQLMEKGKLSIDDPIGKYLDIFPKDIGDKVTIRHLLNMKSGWGDYWGDEYYLANKDQLKTVSDYMEFIKDIPLDFEPGTNFQHCNTGFEVAGAIIEKVSGLDYYNYIKKYIYKPAGMSNTDSYFKDEPVVDRATGYTNMSPTDPNAEGYESDNFDMLPSRGTPAGGGYSTVEDMLKFVNALKSYKLLAPGYTKFLLNRLNGNPGDQLKLPKKPYRIVGGAPGIFAYLEIDFQSSNSIILLSNIDNREVMDIAKEISAMIEIE